MRYAKYKPTGIAWLPELPEEWEIMRLSYLFDIQLGKMLDTKRITGNYLVPYLRNQDVQWGRVNVDGLPEMDIEPEERERFLVKRGDLLVCEGGEIGKSAIWGNDWPCYIQKAIMRLRSRDGKKATVAFMFYLMRGMTGLHVFDNATGKATIAHLPAEKLSRHRIPLPPLPTQRAIVAFLDERCGAVDRLVAAKEKEVALLKELKQSVIAEAVTGGVREKVKVKGAIEADGRNSRSKANGLREQRKLKPSGIPWLPELPEGWEVLRNKAFLKLTDEKVGLRKDFVLLSLTKQGVIIRDLTDMKGKFPKDFDTYLVVRPNNLVFCLFDVDETPRTVGLVKNEGMLTGAYTNFEVDATKVLPEYAYYYYLHIDNAKKLRPYYTGLRKVVKTNTFLQLRIPVPPLAEQREIVAHIEARAAKIDAAVSGLEREIAALKEWKQRLIADVVTGQRKVAPQGATTRGATPSRPENMGATPSRPEKTPLRPEKGQGR